MEREKDINTRIDTEVTRDFEQMHTQLGSLLSNCADGVIHIDEQRPNWPTGFFDLYGCAKDDDSFVRPSQGDPSLDDNPSVFFN